MAFSGLHVVCGFAGVPSANRSVQPVLSNVRWSQSPSSGTPTTQAAPGGAELGNPIFRVESSADVWVSVGPNPDASVSPRVLVRATTAQPYDIGVQPGDKLAWVAA